MRAARAVWIYLVILGYFTCAVHIALGVISLYYDDWRRISLPATQALQAGQHPILKYSRTRGLWRECVNADAETAYKTDAKVNEVCRKLEFPLDGKLYAARNVEILNFRATQPGLVVAAMTITAFVMLGLMVQFLCLLSNRSPPRPRSGQYACLFGGFSLWLAGLVHFLSFILYHEMLDQENSQAQTDLQTARANWFDMKQVTESLGAMYFVGWGSCIACFVASWIFLGAAAVQTPPKLRIHFPTSSLSTIHG